jgi:TonB-dependent receptor
MVTGNGRLFGGVRMKSPIDFRGCGINLRKTMLSASASVLALTAMPALAQSAGGASPAAAPAQDASADGQTGDIVVLGVRGAQQSAVNIKRRADQMVDSVVAEDIGRLPDTTIADSLQRVPGVQIGRSAGEGATINIRGLPEVLVTLNGEQFLGGQNMINAQPNLEDVPPTLFAGVDVYKSPTADQLSGGVSGIISLRTRRPFDLQHGLTLSGNIQGDYGDEAKHWNKLASGLVGYNADRWGVLVAASYSDELLANYDYDLGTSWRKAPTTGSDQAANSPFFYESDVPNISDRITERRRLGVNGSGQVKIGSSLQLTGDVSYNQLFNNDRVASMNFNSNFGPLTLLPGSIVDKNGVLEKGVYHLTDWNTNTQSSPDHSHALNTNLELAFNDGGRFKGSVRWVHGDARNHLEHSEAGEVPNKDNIIPRGGPATCGPTPGPTPTGECQYANPNGLDGVDASLDYRGAFPKINFMTDVTNPDNYTMISTWGDGIREHSTLDAYRADGSFDTDGLIPLIKSIDFGARYGDHSIAHTEFKYLAPVAPGLDAPGDLYYYKDPTVIHNGPTLSGVSVVPLHPFSSIPQYIGTFSNFGPVTGVPSGGVPMIDPHQMDNPKAFQDALFPGNVAYTDPTRSFRVTQKETSAYVQANFGSDSGLIFNGNVGLRVVHTDRTIYSFLTDPSQYIGTAGNWNGVELVKSTLKNSKKYTDWLPDANVAFDVASDMKLRFAFAKVVGAQNLFDLAAGTVYNYSTNGTPGRIPTLPPDAVLFSSGSAGNPDLEPYRSTNYNATYEWYFGHGGLLSAGVFLFDVKSFPEVVTTIEPIPDADGVVRQGGPFTQTVNGHGGKIKGLELGYQQNFDFLPGAFNGLGMDLNFTLSDSQSSNKDIFGKTLPVPDNSKYQYNAVVYYQKYGIQARVAYNLRSNRFVGMQAAGDDNLAVWSKPEGYLDASISYDINKHLTVYAQGTNLTKTHTSEYMQFKNLFYAAYVTDRRAFFGIRIRN